MARYPLIIKDKTYLILLQEGAKTGKSMGKFLNEIIDAYAQKLVNGSVENPQESLNPHCMTCAGYVGRTQWCRVDGQKHLPMETCVNFRRG